MRYILYYKLPQMSIAKPNFIDAFLLSRICKIMPQIKAANNVLKVAVF